MGSNGPVVRHSDRDALNVLGVSVRFVCTAEETQNAWSLMENLIPKDCGPPPHHHPWGEAYYVVSGEVDFTIDGAPQKLAAGDFLYAPGGTIHAFRGASDDPAKMLIFDAPAHAEAFFREAHELVRRIPEDLPKMGEIGQRHQVHFIPAS